MTSASCTPACSAPQVNSGAALVVSLRLLFRDPHQPGPEALFAALLNDLCVCGHSISSAGLRDGRIELALEGFGFSLGTDAPSLSDQGATPGPAPRAPHRPDLPAAALRSAALGLTYVRQRFTYALELMSDTPDAIVSALLDALFQHLQPDAVLLDPQHLMLTPDEARYLPLSDLLHLNPGAALPHPKPRYERPTGQPPARRKSVFARKEPARNDPEQTGAERTDTAPVRSPNPVADPIVAPSAFSTARPAPRTGTALPVPPTSGTATQSPHISRFGDRAIKPKQPPVAPPDIALTREMCAVLRAAAPARAPVAMRDRASTLVVSSASVLCDGLTVVGPNGEKRVVATHLLTASVLFGLSTLLVGGMSGMAGHMIALI